MKLISSLIISKFIQVVQFVKGDKIDSNGSQIPTKNNATVWENIQNIPKKLLEIINDSALPLKSSLVLFITSTVFLLSIGLFVFFMKKLTANKNERLASGLLLILDLFSILLINSTFILIYLSVQDIIVCGELCATLSSICLLLITFVFYLNKERKPCRKNLFFRICNEKIVICILAVSFLIFSEDLMGFTNNCSTKFLYGLENILYSIKIDWITVPEMSESISKDVLSALRIPTAILYTSLYIITVDFLEREENNVDEKKVKVNQKVKAKNQKRK